MDASARRQDIGEGTEAKEKTSMANVLFRDKSILLRFSARQDVGQSEQRFKLLELCSAGFPIVQTQAKC